MEKKKGSKGKDADQKDPHEEERSKKREKARIPANSPFFVKGQHLSSKKKRQRASSRLILEHKKKEEGGITFGARDHIEGKKKKKRRYGTAQTSYGDERGEAGQTWVTLLTVNPDPGKKKKRGEDGLYSCQLEEEKVVIHLFFDDFSEGAAKKENESK